MPAGVRRRPGRRPARVFFALLLHRRLALGTATAVLAAAAALSLARQGQPLQLPEVHSRQPHRRLQVLAAPLRPRLVALLLRLLRQSPNRKSTRLTSSHLGISY